MKQYGNQNHKKTSKMKKILKNALFIFPFLLNDWSLSELSNLEEFDQSFEKSKFGRFKIFDFRLMFFLKNLNDTLSES